MTRHRTLATVCCICTLLHAADFAAAQSAPPSSSESSRWEIEVHGGGMLSSHPTDGIASLPEPGAPFTTIARLPSRRVSSWFFGDGALLLNQAHEQWGPASGSGIVTLNSVLNSASARRERGASLGVRLSRRVGRRLAAEFSVDYEAGRFSLNEEAAEAIEESRSSAVRTLADMLVNNAPVVVATALLDRKAGRMVTTTGALNIQFSGRGRVAPFVVAGGGMTKHIAGGPSIALQSEYAITGRTTGRTLVEGDRVNVHYSLARHVPVALVGGGVRYALSSRWVLRVDARGHFVKNTLKVMVDATPESSGGAPVSGSFVTALGTNPSLQFSDITVGPFAQPSSLSGPALQDFVTFSGRGIQRHLSITTGLAWRF